MLGSAVLGPFIHFVTVARIRAPISTPPGQLRPALRLPSALAHSALPGPLEVILPPQSVYSTCT